MPAGVPVTVGPVIGATVVGSLGAVLVYTGILRFFRNPVRVFGGVVLIVLVLSFGSPLSIQNVPMKMIVALNVLHVTTAAILYGVLTSRIAPVNRKTDS